MKEFENKKIDDMTYGEIKEYIWFLENEVKRADKERNAIFECINRVDKYYNKLHIQAFEEWKQDDKESEREYNVTFGSTSAMSHLKFALNHL